MNNANSYHCCCANNNESINSAHDESGHTFLVMLCKCLITNGWARKQYIIFVIAIELELVARLNLLTIRRSVYDYGYVLARVCLTWYQSRSHTQREMLNCIGRSNQTKNYFWKQWSEFLFLISPRAKWEYCCNKKRATQFIIVRRLCTQLCERDTISNGKRLNSARKSDDVPKNMPNWIVTKGRDNRKKHNKW